ncbi:MAG: hypothetical protein WC238_02110 [Parcubacteria group bacterium]|jgi:hypothetical protein
MENFYNGEKGAMTGEQRLAEIKVKTDDLKKELVFLAEEQAKCKLFLEHEEKIGEEELWDKDEAVFRVQSILRKKIEINEKIGRLNLEKIKIIKKNSKETK